MLITGERERPTILHGSRESGDIGPAEWRAHHFQRVSLHIRVRATRTAAQHLPEHVRRFDVTVV